jgi:cytolysin-activating lysine-acyltransferase
MNHHVLGAAVALMAASDRHEVWIVRDVARLMMTPLHLEQYVAIWDEGRMVALATWARLTDQAAQGYVTGQRRLQPEDWTAGDQIWLIDAIAPWGHARQVTSLLRIDLKQRGHKGDKIRFRRNYGGAMRFSEVVI